MAARWLIFLLYVGLVGLVGWTLLRRIRGAWAAASGSPAGQRGIRLFVFALLCLFFAGAAKQVLVSGARFVGRMFVAVPFQVVTDRKLGDELARTGFGGDFSTVLSFLADGVGNAVRAAHLERLPYLQIVVFAALFVLLTRLLSLASGAKDDARDAAQHGWLKRAWTSIGARRRQNGYLGVVLLGAAYLCAAALMALPELDAASSVPESVSPDKLRERLGSMQMSADELAQVFPERVQGGEDPFAKIKSLLEKPPKPVLESGPDGQPPPPMMMAQAPPMIELLEADTTRAVAAGDARRAELASLWRELRSEVYTLQRHALDHALLGYENENLNRMGVRQTIEHFRKVSNWYQDYVLRTRTALAGCQTAVQQADKSYEDWAQRASEVIRSAYLYGGKAGRDREYVLPDPPDTDVAKVHCAPGGGVGGLPRRDEAGANLKPVFRFVGGWLIGQESLQLALLVGMVGFGLLGAAISSIVRRRRGLTELPEDHPLVSNLAELVIRGVSAAVVVFLTVKGGLSLFGASDAAVNPYVVLLTCFAAAIYSEDAWARVRGKFGPRGAAAGGGEPPAPTPTDPPPPPANE